MGSVGDTLLERAESRAALDELLAGVQAGGEGRLVLIGGEAGVGKTALARSFCAAQTQPVRVLWGACALLIIANIVNIGADLETAESEAKEGVGPSRRRSGGEVPSGGASKPQGPSHLSAQGANRRSG